MESQLSTGSLLPVVKRSVLFLFLSCLAVWTIGLVLEKIALKVDTSYPQVVAAMSLQGQSRDVVFLGDSTTSQSVNPEAVFRGSGFSGYNLSNIGTNFISMLGSLNHYLENNERPRLVAIGVFVNKDDLDNGIIPNLYLSFSAENQALISRLLEKHGDNTVGFKYRLMNSVTAYRLRDTIASALKAIAQGEARMPEFIDGHLALSVRLAQPSIPPTTFGAGFKYAMLRDLLEFCREQKLPVVLFEPPGSPGFDAVVNGRERVLAQLQSLVDEGLAREFVSFNDPANLPFETGEWVNTNHLNRFGAERFSRQHFGPWIQSVLHSH